MKLMPISFKGFEAAVIKKYPIPDSWSNWVTVSEHIKDKSISDKLNELDKTHKYLHDVVCFDAPRTINNSMNNACIVKAVVTDKELKITRDIQRTENIIDKLNQQKEKLQSELNNRFIEYFNKNKETINILPPW